MKIVQEFFEGEVKVIKPDVFGDDRGFFMESFNQKKFDKIGITNSFVQDNHSFSVKKGTIRGLHFQNPPMDQSKLVRVIKGSAVDYFVDIREGSPSFGKWEQVTLSEENHLQVIIPKGFAHGFCTLEDNTHFVYKVDNYYSGECNNGIIWDDPELGIDWGVSKPTLSKQDTQWGRLSELRGIFTYEK